jgi:hypothetical protein
MLAHSRAFGLSLAKSSGFCVTRLCKQGVAGSNPVTSTNFFLIAEELEKSPRPERSIIRATVRELVAAKSIFN